MASGNGFDLVADILVVDEYHLVGGLVHALQKTVTAVIDAIEHMREIIIVLATETVALGCGQYAPAALVGDDQCRVAFLQSKVLRPAVEDFTVALDLDYR